MKDKPSDEYGGFPETPSQWLLLLDLLGMTVTDFAKAVDVHHTRVGRLLTGGGRITKPDSYAKLTALIERAGFGRTGAFRTDVLYHQVIARSITRGLEVRPLSSYPGLRLEQKFRCLSAFGEPASTGSEPVALILGSPFRHESLKILLDRINKLAGVELAFDYQPSEEINLGFGTSKNTLVVNGTRYESERRSLNATEHSIVDYGIVTVLRGQVEMFLNERDCNQAIWIAGAHRIATKIGLEAIFLSRPSPFVPGSSGVSVQVFQATARQNGSGIYPDDFKPIGQPFTGRSGARPSGARVAVWQGGPPNHSSGRTGL